MGLGGITNFNAKKMARRMEGATDSSVDNAPNTMAHVAGRAKIPDHNALGIAANLGPVIEHVNNLNKFAGVPGALVKARDRALQYSQPGVRQSALGFIDWLQSLPEDQQVAVQMWVNGRATTDNTEGAELVAGEFGGDAQTNYDQVLLPPTDRATDFIAGLHSLFGHREEANNVTAGADVTISPEVGSEGGSLGFAKDVLDLAPDAATSYGADLQRGLHLDTGAAYLDSITDPEDRKAVDQVREDILDPQALQVMDGAERYIDPKNKLSYFGTIPRGWGGIKALAGVGQSGVNAGIYTAVTAGSQLASGVGIDPAQHEASGDVVRAGEKRMGQAIESTLGWKAQHLNGLKPGTPEYADQVNADTMLAAIVLEAVLHTGAGVAKGAKLGREIPGDFGVPSEFNLDQPLLRAAEDVPTGIGGKVSRTLEYATVGPRAVNRALGRLGWNITTKTAEEFWAGRRGGKLAQQMWERIADVPQEERAGVLQEVYGTDIDMYGMDSGLARELSKAGHVDDVRRIMADEFANPGHHTAGTVEGLKARQAEIDRELDDFEGEAAADDPGGSPEMQRVREAESARDEILRRGEEDVRGLDNPDSDIFQQLDNAEAELDEALKAHREAQGVDVEEVTPQEGADGYEIEEFGVQPTGIGATVPKGSFQVTGPSGEYVVVSRLEDGTFRINYSEVPEGLRGQGLGAKLYARAAKEATARGGKFVSDLSLSKSARGLWEKLVRQGKAIEHPAPPEPPGLAADIREAFDLGETEGGTTFEYVPSERVPTQKITLPADRASKALLERDRLVQELEDGLRETGEIDADVHEQLMDAEAELEASRRFRDETAPRLRMQRDHITAEIERLRDRVPLARYPKRNIIRAAIRHPHTPAERFMAMVFDGSWFGKRGSSLDPARFVDEVVENPTFPTPYVREDWRAANADTVSRVGRIARVPQDVIERRIGALDGVDTLLDHEKWVSGFMEEIGENLPKNTPKTVRDAIVRLTDNVEDANTMSRVAEEIQSQSTGRTDVRSRPVLAEGTHALPSMETEFHKGWQMGDIQTLIDAQSHWARMLKAARGNLIGKPIVGLLHDLPQWFFKSMTDITKGPTMAQRLPSMAARIQLDQTVRNWAHGGKAVSSPDGIHLFHGGIPITPPIRGINQGAAVRIFQKYFGEEGWEVMGEDPALAGIAPPTPEDVGAAVSREFLSEGAATQYSPHPMEGVNNGSRPLQKLEVHAAQRQIEILSQTPTMRVLARAGGDPQALVDFVDRLGPDGILQDGVRVRDIDEMLARDDVIGALPEAERHMAWAEQKAQQLKEQTFNDPAYMDAVARGRHTRGLGPAVKRAEGGGLVPTDGIDGATGQSVRSRYYQMRQRISNIDERLGVLDRRADRVEIKMLQQERRETWFELQEHRRKNGDFLTPDQDVIKTTDKIALRSRIKDDFEQGRIDMPNEVSVKDRVHESWDMNRSAPAVAAARVTEAINDFSYSMFKPLSYIDLRATRGSLYYQFASQEIRSLLARGISREDALALGQMRAMRRTVDIMYDLTAKTPIQRAVKDMFWFAPAFQEVLYTWGVKIPSQSYGLAIPAALGKATIAYAVLKEANLIQHNEATGDDEFIVPGLGAIIDALPGVRAPNDVGFNPKSALFIQPNPGAGGLPTPGLSTGVELALGTAATNVGGIFKQISDVLMPFGPERDLTTGSITAGYEAVTGHIAPWAKWSNAVAERRFGMAHNTAMRYAYTSMLEDGIKAPNPNDFSDITVEGVADLSGQARLDYNKAHAAYIQEVLDRADDFMGGTALLQFLSAVGSPVSLRPSSEEQREYQDWFGRTFGTYDEVFAQGDGLTDKQYDQIAEHISRYPESMAWATFSSARGEKTRDLPFEDSPDDQVMDDYLSGLRVVMTPEQFAEKLAYTETRRIYDEQQTKALNEFAPPGPDQLYNLLANGAQKGSAMREHSISLQRYLDLNGEYGAFVEEQNRLMDAEDKVPEQAFMIERAAQAKQYISQLTDFMTGTSGVRSSSLREVMSNLTSLYADDPANSYGGPRSFLDRGQEYFYDQVGKYFDETSGLIDQANEREANGLSSSDIWQQIDVIGQRYEGMEYQGRKLPSMEEFFYGNKTEAEQRASKFKWASQPQSWLSDFKLDTVGYDYSPETRDVLRQADALDAQLNQHIIDNDIDASSEEFDKLQAWRQRKLYALAADAGPEATEAINYMLVPPAARLGTLPEFERVPAWGELQSKAAAVANQIQQHGDSVRGWSAGAEAGKIWFMRQVATLRETDSQLDDLLTELGYAIPEDGADQREGATLYDAIFFGNFNPDYIPDAVKQEVAQYG